MTTSLEDDLRDALARQADRTTVDPNAEFGDLPLPLRVDNSRRSRPRVLVPVLAAAAALAVVGGLVVVTQMRDELPAQLTTPPPVDSTAAAIGLFPAGDLAAVKAAGHGTPQSAVQAYLADRTRSEVLPDDETVSYSVSDLGPRVRDDLAIVGFSLTTDNDSGDGLLLVRQVASASEPERWVVLNGGVATFTIDQLDYHDGQLSGSFSSEIGGQTEISVYDAVTGERVGRSTDNPFVIDGLGPSAVTVRFWNTIADGGYPIAVFAEALVHDGETVSNIGEGALHDTYYTAIQQATEPSSEPFDTGPIAAFLSATAGDTVAIVDEPQLEIDAGVQFVEHSGQTEYCLAIAWAGQELTSDDEAACFSADDIAAQRVNQSFGVLDAIDGSEVLVFGAVSDAVSDIRTESGENITPIHNVWWDVIDSGSMANYKIITADGRTTTITAG